MLPTTDEALRLARLALDEFDERPLSVSIRRAVRIANLIGESQTAIRLRFELVSAASGGSPSANTDDMKRLLVDPAMWGQKEGPAGRALKEYFEDRTHGDGQIQGMSIMQLEWWNDYAENAARESHELMTTRMDSVDLMDRIRLRTFTALCAWERQLTFGSTNQSIFSEYQRTVDRMLAEGAPHLVDQFNAVYRRLHDAATAGSEAAVSEELSQAVATCRRINKAVIDHVMPGEHGAMNEDGHVLDNEKYRNRLHEIIKQSTSGTTLGEVVFAQAVGLTDRFEALDTLASKGVHASVALNEAELLAISTYIVVGEILRLAVV